jgi:hypothetical protein
VRDNFSVATNLGIYCSFEEEGFLVPLFIPYLTVETPIIAFMALPIVFHNPPYAFTRVPFKGPSFEGVEEVVVNL